MKNNSIVHRIGSQIGGVFLGLFLILSTSLMAQQQAASGKVKGSDGGPVIGASVSVVGTIAELKIEGGWLYHIKALSDGGNYIWVPEHRVRPISKSIYDDCYIEPRAGLQEQLTDERGRAKK
jgi:hypothetical protein